MTELNKIEFSSLQARYESVALHINSKKQQFRIRVSGYDKSEVEEYINKLQGSFEVLSGETPQPLPEANFSDSEREIELSTNFNKEVHLDKKIQITIEAIEIPEVLLPIQLKYTLNMVVRQGTEQTIESGNHYTSSTELTQGLALATVTLRNGIGPVDVKISGGKDSPRIKSYDTLNDQHKKTEIGRQRSRNSLEKLTLIIHNRGNSRVDVNVESELWSDVPHT